MEAERKIINQWIEKFLPFEVLDFYALAYEKSKKADEIKRKNKKYQKYYKKAENELLPQLEKFLIEKIEQGKIDKDELDQEKIKAEIIKILNSEMHANLLVKAIKNHFNKKSSEHITKKAQLKEEIKIDELKGKTEKNNKQETPKTEQEFFKKYNQEKGFTNFYTGKEYKILGYNPVKQRVSISVYQVSCYDEKNKAHSFLDDKNRWTQEDLNFNEFKELFENSFLNEGSFELSSREKERKLLKKFSKKEKDFLQEALVEYVADYKNDLEAFLKSQKQSEEAEFIENKRSKYLDNFWSVELPKKLEDLADIISLNKKTEVISYLKLKEN